MIVSLLLFCGLKLVLSSHQEEDIALITLGSPMYYSYYHSTRVSKTVLDDPWAVIIQGKKNCRQQSLSL